MISKKFRQKKKTKQEENVQEKHDQQNYTELDFQIQTNPPIIFLDGYNIIGYTNMLEKSTSNSNAGAERFLISNDNSLSASRDSLIADINTLQRTTGF